MNDESSSLIIHKLGHFHFTCMVCGPVYLSFQVYIITHSIFANQFHAHAV